MEPLLLFLFLDMYVAYGLGFAVGMADEGDSLWSLLIDVMFWPFYKGLKDGADFKEVVK